jgi:hypothetical protein
MLFLGIFLGFILGVLILLANDLIRARTKRTVVLPEGSRVGIQGALRAPLVLKARPSDTRRKPKHHDDYAAWKAEQAEETEKARSIT